MRILLTGASGFLGSAIQQTLTGHELIAFGRNNADIIGDLTLPLPPLPEVDWVIHAAGYAHVVPEKSASVDQFHNINVNGTENLLRALESNKSKPAAFIFISSVAVYGVENGKNINENHPLTASDPYGRSKITAEHKIQEWCIKHGIICCILRLPLLVGQTPPGNLKAMIKAIKGHYYFNIAHGKARRSMVLVHDIASIIPLGAEKGGIFNLTDGFHPSFYELSSDICRILGLKDPINIPLWMARIIAAAGSLLGAKAPINNRKLKKMINDLTFDDQKARTELNWTPRAVLGSGWFSSI